MSARTLVLINNRAARARRAWPQINRMLAEGDVGFDACEAKQPGDTERWTRQALREGYGIIAVVGGDGTLSEAASGFFEPYTKPEEGCGDGGGGTPRRVEVTGSLAVLPAGTGDDFARSLAGGRRTPLSEWVARLVAAHCRNNTNRNNANHRSTRPIDLLYARVSGEDDGGSSTRRFICLNAATLGIGAEVACRVAGQKSLVRRFPGEARFALAAARELAAWRERRVRIRVDTHPPFECSSNLIAIVNNPYAGGGMKFAPEAAPDDGYLDVMTACDVSRAGVVRELTRIHRGGHVVNPRVRLDRGRRVRVETIDPEERLAVEADGDVRGYTPLEFSVMPNALQVIF